MNGRLLVSGTLQNSYPAPRSPSHVRLCEATGRAYRTDGFGATFARVRAAAGLPDTLQFRDLRRTAATEAAAGGATVHELKAMTGHKGTEILKVYVRPTDTGAKEAQRKRETARGKNTR